MKIVLNKVQSQKSILWIYCYSLITLSEHNKVLESQIIFIVSILYSLIKKTLYYFLLFDLQHKIWWSLTTSKLNLPI
jgi:hypothetical protein